MNIERYFNTEALHSVSGLFSVCGSFGRIDHTATYDKKEKGNVTRFTHENGAVRMVSEWTELEYGVIRRKDTLVNLTDTQIEINTLLSRFTLVGNEYEVYTQYNGWQHESTGHGRVYPRKSAFPRAECVPVTAVRLCLACTTCTRAKIRYFTCFRTVNGS